MNTMTLPIRYIPQSYPAARFTIPIYQSTPLNGVPNPTGFNNSFVMTAIMQILQQLITNLRTQGQTQTGTPTPSNTATILTFSTAQGMSEYHRHTAPGKPSPMIRHNQAEDYKEILVQTSIGPRIVANPGPQIVANANQSNALKQFFNVSYTAPFTTTIYDNDRSGGLSANDLIYMNDNVTGAPIKEHLLTAAEAKALGIN